MERIDKWRFQIEDLLISEALCLENDKGVFNTLINILVVEYFKHVDVDSITPTIKLALSIIFVGTEKLDILPVVFKMLQDWEWTKGPYWIVQEELIRHAGIHEIGLLCDRSQISVDPRHCKSSWNDLIGNANVEGITPIRLRQRLLLLSSELDGLIELADKNYSLFQIIFQQYRDQHDFNKYVIWFNQWARDLLSRNASYEASQILRLADVAFSNDATLPFILTNSSINESLQKKTIKTIFPMPRRCIEEFGEAQCTHIDNSSSTAEIRASFQGHNVTKSSLCSTPTVPCASNHRFTTTISTAQPFQSQSEHQQDTENFNSIINFDSSSPGAECREFFCECGCTGEECFSGQHNGREEQQERLIPPKTKITAAIALSIHSVNKRGSGSNTPPPHDAGESPIMCDNSTFIKTLQDEIWTAFSPWPAAVI